MKSVFPNHLDVACEDVNFLVLCKGTSKFLLFFTDGIASTLCITVEESLRASYLLIQIHEEGWGWTIVNFREGWGLNCFVSLDWVLAGAPVCLQIIQFLSLVRGIENHRFCAHSTVLLIELNLIEVEFFSSLKKFRGFFFTSQLGLPSLYRIREASWLCEFSQFVIEVGCLYRSLLQVVALCVLRYNWDQYFLWLMVHRYNILVGDKHLVTLIFLIVLAHRN